MTLVNYWWVQIQIIVPTVMEKPTLRKLHPDLSPQDVNETAMTLALQNGLLAYLPFDETNGTEYVMDVSCKGRYATLIGFEWAIKVSGDLARSAMPFDSTGSMTMQRYQQLWDTASRFHFGSRRRVMQGMRMFLTGMAQLA